MNFLCSFPTYEFSAVFVPDLEQDILLKTVNPLWGLVLQNQGTKQPSGLRKSPPSHPSQRCRCRGRGLCLDPFPKLSLCPLVSRTVRVLHWIHSKDLKSLCLLEAPFTFLLYPGVSDNKLQSLTPAENEGRGKKQKERRDAYIQTFSLSLFFFLVHTVLQWRTVESKVMVFTALKWSQHHPKRMHQGMFPSVMHKGLSPHSHVYMVKF